MRIIPSMGIAKTCANLANCGNRGMTQWRNGPRKPACFQQSWTLEILEGFTSDVWTFPTNRLLVDEQFDTRKRT